MSYRRTAREHGLDPERLTYTMGMDFMKKNPDPDAPWIDIELPEQRGGIYVMLD